MLERSIVIFPAWAVPDVGRGMPCSASPDLGLVIVHRGDFTAARYDLGEQEAGDLGKPEDGSGAAGELGPRQDRVGRDRSRNSTESRDREASQVCRDSDPAARDLERWPPASM